MELLQIVYIFGNLLVIREFCRISLESFNKEINNKVLNTAALKLNLMPQDLKELIELISWIFVENSRLRLNEKELKESLTLVGFRQEFIEEIYTNISNSSSQIENYLENLSLATTSYSNLEWRIDVKVATRSLRKCVEPEIILKLDLAKGQDEQKETHLFQTDVVNLIHLTNCLDDALNEIKTNYCRRVFRNIV